MTRTALRPIAKTALTAACAGLLSACAGTPTATERELRADLDSVSRLFRPGGTRPALPDLSAASTLADLLRFAMLNSPRVEASYYQWAAAVERITPARSLPDPRLTFEADITDMIDALMPGLMMDLPGPGKLRAAGDIAAGEAAAGYFAFEAEVLRTALAVKSSYYRLHFLKETIRVQRATLSLLSEVEQIAQTQSAAGRVAFQDVLQAQIAREQLATQIDNLEDFSGVLLAELKAALGLGTGAPDPAVPGEFEPSLAPQSADAIFAAALERNPSLRRMAADVRRAEAMLDLARTSGIPDFSLGIEADVRASPVLWRPSAGVTLPIWRDKIAAQIAAAQAEKQSAEAQLTAEQVSLAAELASMLYMYGESSRNTNLLVEELIPRARQALEVARLEYSTGRSSFMDLIDTQRQLLGFELALVEARTQRELALSALSLSIEGVLPVGAPVLAPITSTQPFSQSISKETLP